jgi:NTP pyrophosphatase (non-canonical NTP hydrolase)
MKLMFHVLRNNPKQNIDNETINFRNISFKLLEEFNEVMKAISNYNKSNSLRDLKEIIRETFDLIQICILILWKCNRQAQTFDEENLIQEVNFEHKDKLINRGWIIKTGIEVDVKE